MCRTDDFLSDLKVSSLGDILGASVISVFFSSVPIVYKTVYIYKIK